MAITNDFVQAVEEKKLLRVRIMLKDSFLIDPTGVMFDEMATYAEEHLSELYHSHDGEALDFDVATWNTEYLNQQLVSVINNFSKERIELIKAMSRYLLKDKVNNIRNERSKKQTIKIQQKHIGYGVTATGVVPGVTGLCVSQPILTVAGVVVIAAGVTLVLTDKEKKQ